MIALLIVVGYLATTVLPAAWAMRVMSDRPTPSYCHGTSVDGNKRLMDGRVAGSNERTCLKWHGQGCWRSDAVVGYSQRVMTDGMGVGLIWPLLILPVLALHIAKRKPTPGALQRSTAELEKEVDL